MTQRPFDKLGDALLRARRFREHARECQRLSKSAQLRETREIYERLAASYEELANDMEMIQQHRLKKIQ